MDRVSAPNYATVGGKRQFVDLDLATNTPGTGLDAVWHTGVQESIILAVEAGGLVPTDADNTQLLQVIGGGAIAGHGQCRLRVSSATVLTLSPFNGRRIVIDGAGYTIPQASITISNAGLAANTLYRAYVFNNAGTLALELSTTGHSTDATAANYGVEIKTGDATRTLVGMIQTGAGTPGVFQVQATNLVACVNWFNRKTIGITGNAAIGSTASSTFVTVGGSTTQCATLLWADEALLLTCSGEASINSGSGSVSCLIDGAAFGTTPFVTALTSSFPISAAGASSPSEGFHTFSCGVSNTGGGTTTVNIALQGLVRG